MYGGLASGTYWKSLVVGSCWVAAAATVALWRPASLAQAPAAAGAAAYLEMNIDPPYNDRAELGRRKTQVQNVLRGASLRDNLAEFQAYYNNYFFKSMTRLDELGELAKKRQELKSQFLWAASRKDVHDELTNLTRKVMEYFLQPNEKFHPGVKYNAILIIGDLNDREANPAAKQPPVPLPDALGVLVREYENPNQSEAVRLGAMIGMLRHAQLNSAQTDQAAKNRVVSLMLDLVNAKNPPSGRTAEAHAWLQGRAVDILAAFGDPGPGGNIATAVESVVADANAPLWLRCVAARALGSFKYTKYAADARLNPSEAARKLGEFAVAACRNELDRIEEARRREQERQLAKSGGFSMFRGAAPAGGGPVGSPAAGAENPAAAGAGDPAAGAGDPAAGAGDPAAAGDPMAGAGGPTAGMAGGTPGGAGPARSPAESASAEEVAKVDLTRRRLKYHLFCVRSGLTGHGDRKKITPQQEGEKLGGVMILTDPSNRGFVEQVIGAVDAVDEVLDVKADAVEEASVTLETITQELRNKVNELTSSLSPAGVAAEGAPGPAPADQPDTDAPGGGKTPPSTPPGKKTPAAMSGVKAATGNVPTGKKPAGKSAGGAAPSGKKPAGKAPTGKPAKK